MWLKKICILLILSILIVLYSLNIGMFSDNVLFASKMGNALFQSGIFNWGSIPLEIDPGHPPFLATLMAVGWTLFGKSLVVSHLMMLPFVFGLMWQLVSFISFFVKDKFLIICSFLLVIADPTLLSNLVLVNVEIIQLFFFFVAINAILRSNSFFKIVGLALLSVVSYRGMMLCGGVFIIDAVMHIVFKKRTIKSFFTEQRILEYSVAALPAVIYLIWRLLTKGWIISNPLEIWGSAWHYSTVQEFLNNFFRNIIVLVQRFIDFGRLIPLLFVAITLFIKRKSLKWAEISPLIIIFFFSTIVIYVISLLINNPMGHRYFLPSYLAMGLLSFLLIREYNAKKTIYGILLGCLILGNLIVYPDRFAQGWDASLAHLPYWNLRKDAIRYMDDRGLSVAETASFFPNSTSIDNIDLNGDMRSFISFTGSEKYVLYSNVYNLSDEDYDVLQNEYRILKTFERFNVRIELMQKICN